VAARNVLVVANESVGEQALRGALAERLSAADAHVRVVAPVSGLSWLHWLTNEEDADREEARAVAERAAGAIDAETVEAEVGAHDPVQAIEDALRTFPADEIVVVTVPGEDSGFLEEGAVERARERFGIPVEAIVVDAG
jgi:hypothetical protein